MLKVFISHAPEDERACRALTEHLASEEAAQAVRLFYPGRLRGGEDVAAARARELRQADAVVVLLGPGWLADRALCDEAEAALRRGAQVLPVRWRSCRVQGTPLGRLQALPRGGDPISQARDPDAAWAEVADALAILCRPPLDPDTTVGDVLRAALRLDRQRQWGSIAEEYRRGGAVLFYLYGAWDQSVDWFALRLRTHFLRDLAAAPHELLTLRLHTDGRKTCTAEEWALRLHEELQRRQVRGADLAARLRRAAAERPLFLLLGNQPLDEDAIEGCEDGLRAFLTADLPALLTRAGGDLPVRALLCAQYDADRALVERIAGWAGAVAPGLRFCALPELELPGRRDLEDYLDGYEPRPPPAVREAVLRAYDRLGARRRLSFDDLARLLDRHLEG